MIFWLQLGLQDASSPIIEEFIFFHDYSILVLIFIIISVFLIIVELGEGKFLRLKISENQVLERVWTLLPGLVLVLLAVPSLSLLYILEEDGESGLTVKALGHQWYWSYEIHEFDSPVIFDSYIETPERVGHFRLLDVDNRLVIPVSMPVRLIIRSLDVLHSWTVPSMGVKADACPGRINQVQFLSYRPGVFYGQCSEICGSNHRFMPIVLEVVRLEDYITWCIA